MNTTDAPGNIPNHLVWSILGTIASTILCCMICVSLPGIGTGIAAIVFSSKVDSLLRMGDIEGARHASKTAKTLNLVTAGFVALAAILFIVSLVMLGTDGYMEYMQRMREMRGQS